MKGATPRATCDKRLREIRNGIVNRSPDGGWHELLRPGSQRMCTTTHRGAGEADGGADDAGGLEGEPRP